jgi:NAD(P)H-hydrate epimerase
MEPTENFPVPPHAVVVDALFGTGLSRPLSGDAAAITEHINSHPGHIMCHRHALGLSDDGSTIPDTAVRATCTLSFEFPKRAFSSHIWRHSPGVCLYYPSAFMRICTDRYTARITG